MKWQWSHRLLILFYLLSVSLANHVEPFHHPESAPLDIDITSESPPRSIASPSADSCNNPETCYRYYHAQSSTNDRRSMLVVSTIDGKISALDLSNDCLEKRLAWTLNPGMGAILSSSISKLELLTDQGPVRLVPSLDGGLFTWDGKSVESVPYTADTLLSSSFRLSDDSIIVGAKESWVYGISSRTGELKYQCGSKGCQTYGKEIDENDDIIVIKRNQQTVKAVQPRTGSEKWNFSVGEHELTYSEGLHVRGPCNENQGIDTDCVENGGKQEKMRSTGDSHVNFVVSEGFVAVYNKQSKSSNEPTWTYKFPSAIAAAWKLDGDGVEAIDLFQDSNVPALSLDTLEESIPTEDSIVPAIYMGMYKGQLYIQSSRQFAEAVAEAASTATDEQQTNMSGPRVIWRPYLASAPSRTPALTNSDPTSSSEAALSTWNQYPFDTGYFLFADKTPLLYDDDQCKVEDEGEDDEDNDDDDDTQSIILETLEYIPVSIWTWWREILAISLVLSVVMQLFLSHLKHSLIHTGMVSADQCSQSSHGSSVVSVAEVAEEAASLPTLPQDYMTEYQTLSKPQFQSRYLEDFQQESFLGKGGFGMVFQARNKLDDHVYAIKRITLPNREEARKRVMREVTALADLEHTGIVRYYNAWMESPPPGWQEERDKAMFENLSGSITPTKGSLSLNEINLKSLSEKLEETGKLTTGGQQGEGDFTASNDSWIPFSEVQEKHQLQQQQEFNPFKESKVYESDTEESTGQPVTIPFQNDFLANTSFGNQIRRQDSTASDSFIIFKEGDEEAGEAAASIESTKGFNFSDHVNYSNNEYAAPQPIAQIQHNSNINSSSNQPMPKAYLYIQMQLCQKESLKDWLSENVESRDRQQVLDIFSQILDAVQYIHERTLIHRDLKPSNIFFLGDGTVKVGDFGLVTEMNSAQEEEATDLRDSNQSKRHTGLVGTKLYMSPEQISGKAYNHKVDIFSLGVILFELMHPFSTQMERVRTLSDIKIQKFPKPFLSKAEGKLVQWLLAIEPDERPNTNQITESQLFKLVFKDFVRAGRRRQSSANFNNASF